MINEWCSPECYPAEFCPLALVSCTPFQVLWHDHKNVININKLTTLLQMGNILAYMDWGAQWVSVLD